MNEGIVSSQVWHNWIELYKTFSKDLVDSNGEDGLKVTVLFHCKQKYDKRRLFSKVLIIIKSYAGYFSTIWNER